MSPRPVCFISTLSLQLSQDSPPIPKRKGNAKATLAYHSCTALRQVFHWESSTWPQWANRKGQILLSLPWGIPPQGGICMWITLEKKCVSRHLSLKTKKKCCCEFCHLIFSLTGFWGWVMLWDFFFFLLSELIHGALSLCCCLTFQLTDRLPAGETLLFNRIHSSCHWFVLLLFLAKNSNYR